MILSRSLWMAIALVALAVIPRSISPQTASKTQAAKDFHPLPAAWVGDWEGIGYLNTDPTFPKDLRIDPPNEETDPYIVAHLRTSFLTKREATSYDGSPGSQCDPEGWFPFINYGYGFSLLSSPGKITMVPIEPETEGIRRVYFQAAHKEPLTPTWNGDSIAHWEGRTLVIDTIGYNDLSWLGDDRERHSTELHMIERIDLVRDGKYLHIETDISDPQALTSPYKLTRYFRKENTDHLGAGPEPDSAELVCNEDLSPFSGDVKKVSQKSTEKK